DLIFREQANGPDLVLGVPLRFGIGYGLPLASAPDPEQGLLAIDPESRACFWGGWGGSVILNDVGRGMTLSYVMNRMGPGLLGDRRGADLIVAATAAAS